MGDDLYEEAKSLGVTREQLFEVIRRIRRIREEGGFGNITVHVRGGSVYKVDHTVLGEPAVFKRDASN